MKTIDIHVSSEKSGSLQWKVLVTLFLEILHMDSRWHFFWEGEFLHIRCSDEYAEAVVSLARDLQNVTKVDSPVDWIDDNWLVEKHRWFFERQFHNNSTLAMELYAEYGYPSFELFLLILDRIAHPLANSWFHIAKNAEEKRRMPFEAALVGDYAVSRALYLGGWLQYQKSVQNASTEDISE